MFSKRRSAFQSEQKTSIKTIFIGFAGCLVVAYVLAICVFFSREFSSSGGDGNKIPALQTIKNAADLPKNADGSDHDFHIVFSTSCNMFQGPITQIVSGCQHEGGITGNVHTHPKGLSDTLMTPEQLRQKSNPNLRVHITPSFDEAREFPWANKPMGLNHWLQYADPPVTERVIVIVDPDQIFIDTISQEGRRLDRGELLHGTTTNTSLTDAVRAGRPLAQRYGLGSGWVEKFDRAAICGADSPATRVTHEQAEKHFAAGPPYLLHIDDARALMPLWVKYMQPVYEADKKDIQADMYAYVLAAAHLNLFHNLFDHYMVSAPEANGEGWEWVDTYEGMSCNNPLANKPAHVPTVIHYCANYKVENAEWLLHKGHVPVNILSCDQPLIITPPDDLWKRQTDLGQKRRAWMVCNIIHHINDAALAWKEKFCPRPFVSEKHFRILNYSIDGCGWKMEEGKECWPFARLE